MSETGFQIFHGSFFIGAGLVHAALFTAFFYPFIMPQGRRWRRLVLVFSIYSLSELVCHRTALPQGSFGLTVMLLMPVFSRRCGVEKSFSFLLALLYFNARTSSGLIAESLYFIIELLLPSCSEPLEALFLQTAVLVTLFLLSHAALMAVMLYILQLQMRKQRLPLHWQELYYISSGAVVGILFGQMISKLLVEFRDGIPLQLYERHPAFLVVVPLLAVLSYAGVCLAIRFQQEMAALRDEQAVYFAERQQTRAIRMRIHEVEQSYTRIRQLKHEMRGHLNNIRGLARNGEYASLEDYITQMDESINRPELTLQTGNPVTDVIINDKRQQCLGLGICLQVDFHYPVPGAFDAFDIGIILQNLLQNALEACEKVVEGERFISLTGKRKGRFFLIEVKNSFAGQVVFGQDGLPATDKKRDASLHGIGLSNVLREAKKYMGDLELKTDCQEFCATVLLQEKGNV